MNIYKGDSAEVLRSLGPYYHSILALPTPTIVLSHNENGKYGPLIRRYTGDYYTHAMILMDGHRVVTQDIVLRERPVDQYFDHVLGFYRSPSWGEKERIRSIRFIDGLLNRPWHQRTYDALGILGQAIGIRRIRSPFRYYCSELVADLLKLLGMPLEHTALRPQDLTHYLEKIL